MDQKSEKQASSPGERHHSPETQKEIHSQILHKLTFLLIAVLFSLSCTRHPGEVSWTAGNFSMTLDGKGYITGFYNTATKENFLAKDTLAPLLTLRLDGRMLFPEKAVYNKAEHIVRLSFGTDTEAVIGVEEKESHLVFDLLSVTGYTQYDLVVWGPYPLTLHKYIGETVGTAGGDAFTIGLQALNPKTLGGYPWTDNDCMPQIDIFEQDDLSDISEKNKRYVLYRVEAAKPAAFGSTLQAYCRNRNKPRVIENLHYKKYRALPYDDGGIIHSKIALFGCPTKQTLATIGKIEIAEGLPHPLIDGEWAKTARGAAAAYLIMGFGEDNIDRALAVTRQAGLKYLYHPGPFETWGHFRLNRDQFPEGVESMRRCVKKASRQGIMLGVHTLSNFITTSDAYVTPVPDKRLGTVGTGTLVQPVDAKQTEITLGSSAFFNEYKNSNLKTVMIGEELVRYDRLSENAPWRLLECQRGAWGTRAAAHAAGDTVRMLADHAYKVFLTNAELSREVAQNIARLFNETGLRQISFDGLEGNRSTGMGNYGEILFTTAWYNTLSEEIKKHYIADASRTSHYFWHIYTRMNWGEPWYAGFRKSQTEYRMKNQKYFRRNFMPGMLGWFSMRAETSVEDIEWMLARSAAYDAGYAFVTSFKTLGENGRTEQILALLGRWEKARMSGAFPDTLKKEMENLNHEYHLETAGENQWDLYRVTTSLFSHAPVERQPGEPRFTRFSFNNPYEEQPLTFTLQATKDTECKDITLEMDNNKTLTFPMTLKKGQILSYQGGDSAELLDKTRHRIKTIVLKGDSYTISHGEHMFVVDAEFTGGAVPELQIELKTLSGPVRLTGKLEHR